MEHTKCLIIGSGPAGYTAAIYAGRANLQPIEYCGMQTGGQLTQTTIVENFPGYPEGVDANQMMMELREQAERFGADIRDGVVTAVDLSKKPYTVSLDNGTQIEADTIIIATGASAKYLGLPDERKYNGFLSGQPLRQGIHDSTQTLPTRIRHYAPPRRREPKDRNSIRT